MASFWFDSGTAGGPYSAVVRFTGRRVGIAGKPGPGDTFTKDETIETVIPGTGPVSVTTWVYGLQPGEWLVNAELVRPPTGSARRGGARTRPGDPQPVQPAAWSWRRWSVATAPARPYRTRWALLAPLARQPAVLPGIYTALAIIGFLVGLFLQVVLLGARGVAVEPALGASGLAIVAGLAGAKAWYAVLHPEESLLRGGWAVDGFLVLAPPVAAGALFAFDVPIGVVLDAATPGLFFAVAIGRIGCFFTGCCAGQCTAARWGIWSSDRRVGARRIPTQLLESATGLVIGLTTLLLVLGRVVPADGAVFASAFASYALVRQVLLPLRAERRKSPRTVPLTGVAAGLALVIVVGLILAQGA